MAMVLMVNVCVVAKAIVWGIRVGKDVHTCLSCYLSIEVERGEFIAFHAIRRKGELFQL